MIKYNDTYSYQDKLQRTSSEVISKNIKSFKSMPKLKILCGTNSNLPFECLMTDVISGCLNIKNICYGNCTAADYWYAKGYDFGKRILNDFDENDFRDSVIKLKGNQRWLRQGWVSDCSFTRESWELVARISNILHEYDISMLIITKAYSLPDKSVLETLIKNSAEIRVSISALDRKSELQRRLSFLEDYRNLGGVSVPYVMTSKYKPQDLQDNQSAIVDYIVENDFIAGEHPLRFNRDNKIIKHLDSDGFIHPKFEDQYWFGRLLSHVHNFVLPAPTHLSPEYRLNYKRYSEIPQEETFPSIEGNLPTFEQLLNNTSNFTEGLFKHAAYVIQKS